MLNLIRRKFVARESGLERKFSHTHKCHSDGMEKIHFYRFDASAAMKRSASVYLKILSRT